MSVDPSIIRDLPLFKTFAEKDLLRMAETLSPRHVEHGAFLFQQGDRRGGFTLVLDGMLSVYRELVGGQEIFLARLTRGHVVGYLYLIDGEPRSANVKAIGSVLVGELSDTDFRILIASNTTLGLRFQQAIARDMVRSIRAANRRFTVAATLPTDQFMSPAHLEGMYEDFDLPFDLPTSEEPMPRKVRSAPT